MNVLIVEDETIIAKSIEKNLRKVSEINIIKIAKTYDEAIEKIGDEMFDIFLVDIFLGEGKADGIELAKKIREKNKQVPIVIITSAKSIDYLEKAFEIGVSDYIWKPFNVRELQLRVKRWGNFPHQSFFKEMAKYNNLSYNFQTNQFSLNGEEIELTKKNKILLLLFIEKPEQLLTAEYIKEKYWGDYTNTRKSRNLRSSIQSLRKSLSKTCPDWIQTVRGEGYMLKK